MFNWLNLDMKRAYAVRDFFFKAFARATLMGLGFILLTLALASSL